LAFRVSSSDFKPEHFGFTIRSNLDPYIEAQLLTKGKLFFGNTQAENRTTAIILLVIGALLTLPCMVRCIQTRGGMSSRDDDEWFETYNQQSRGSRDYLTGRATRYKRGVVLI